MNTERREHVKAVLTRDVPDKLAEVGDKLALMDNKLQRVVRERPLLSAAGALAAGFLLGRLLARD